MESVLIVSSAQKATEFFQEMLLQHQLSKVVVLQNAGQARRMLVEREFDLCIINAPLPDELGDKLAASVADKDFCQVILLVKAELCEEISDALECCGVFTVAKPVNKTVFWSALRLANATHHKLSSMRRRNAALTQQIQDIRMVDRAKCMLIEYLRLTEAQAHRYIEKQAMDLRKSRREVAENILKTYEN